MNIKEFLIRQAEQEIRQQGDISISTHYAITAQGMDSEFITNSILNMIKKEQ
jgi:hypothetical protein